MKFEKFVEICVIVNKEKVVNSKTARDYRLDYRTFLDVMERLEEMSFVKKTDKGWVVK